MSIELKVQAEARPFGSCGISFYGSGLSIDDETKSQISSVFKELIREQANRGFGEVYIVREFVFAQDFGGILGDWQRALGRPIGHTRDENGVAAGKALIWGDGKPETTYAVIISTAGVGASVLAGNRFATGMVVHELGHVVDDYFHRRAGFIEPECDANKLTSVLYHVASNIRAEAYAEIFASSYWSPDDVRASVDLSLAMTKSAYKHAEDAIAKWRQDGNTWELWTSVLAPVSASCAQFGRCIGLFLGCGQSSDSEKVRMIAELEKFDPFLVRFFENLVRECAQTITQRPVTRECFASLEFSVLDLFSLIGIEPKSAGENGIWVGVA